MTTKTQGNHREKEERERERGLIREKPLLGGKLMDGVQ